MNKDIQTRVNIVEAKKILHAPNGLGMGDRYERNSNRQIDFEGIL